MITLLVALLPVSIVLVASELLWRLKIIKGEKARKFIHILTGIWMAFWPFYVPFDGIFVLGCVALVLLVYSRLTNLFHAIYAVRRRTYGDILYAVGIIACSMIANAPWIFTVAILFLAVADGGAAVAGRYFGKSNEYLVFGRRSLKKSVIGTVTFIVLAYVSLGIGWMIGGSESNAGEYMWVVVSLPLGAALLENTMPFGLDNIFTPVYAAVLLRAIA